MSILSLALTFFLVANPIGNSPTILSIIKDYDLERQKKIMLRESLFSLLVALFFQFFGELFLNLLHITHYALMLTGGLVLLNTALQMIFHKPEDKKSPEKKREPFIVPIAMPLISGPGMMTMIMIGAAGASSQWTVSLSILIAWIGVTAVLFIAPYLQKLIGKNGMAALEQIMAMLLGLMSVEMLIKGINIFILTLEKGK